MDVLLTVLIGVLSIGGAGFVLVSAVAMLRTRDALSRVNVMSPAAGVGLPAIIAAAFVHHTWQYGFEPLDLFKSLVAVTGFVIISSVASNTLARAAYRSGAPLDPATDPNDLAVDPGDPGRRTR